MIHFDRVPEPDGFDQKVRSRGNQWLNKHPEATRPHDYWSEFKPHLAEGFRNLCGYGAMYEPVGTIDHYIACGDDMSQSYEWDNYRFSAQWINSCKQSRKPGQLQVFDPFEVEDGWFEIELPSLQLKVADRLPPELRERADFTLDQLHLRHDERVLRQRSEWYRMYQDREINFDGLSKKAPLIAQAVEKQLSAQSTVGDQDEAGPTNLTEDVT